MGNISRRNRLLAAIALIAVGIGLVAIPLLPFGPASGRAAALPFLAWICGGASFGGGVGLLTSRPKFWATLGALIGVAIQITLVSYFILWVLHTGLQDRGRY
jgi:hypothetical protein